MSKRHALPVLLLLFVSATAMAQDASGLVVVAFRSRGNNVQLIPGYVIHTHDQHAYVIIREPALRREDRLAPRASHELAIHWDRNGKKHRTRGELAVRYPGAWLVSAPLKEMPKPLLVSKAKVNESDVVGVVGYEIDEAGDMPAFALSSTRGIVKKIYRSPQGRTTMLTISHDHESPLMDGVAFSSKGASLGRILQSNMPRGKDQGEDAAHVVTVQPFDFKPWLEPSIGPVQMVAISGDDKTINYQLVVRIDDAFDRVRDPKLLVWKGEGPKAPGRVQAERTGRSQESGNRLAETDQAGNGCHVATT